MKNLSKHIISILSILFILIFPIVALAQGDPGGDPGVPFDGGASILIASGVAYGVKKYKERKSKKSEESVETESK